MGALWGINSWTSGVESARRRNSCLAAAPESGDAKGLDASTAGLLARLLAEGRSTLVRVVRWQPASFISRVLPASL